MIRFGPSGNSQSFYDDGNKTSVQAPKWLSEKGLNAYEFSFGRGYTMGLKTATDLGNEAEKYAFDNLPFNLLEIKQEIHYFAFEFSLVKQLFIVLSICLHSFS